MNTWVFLYDCKFLVSNALFIFKLPKFCVEWLGEELEPHLITWQGIYLLQGEQVLKYHSSQDQ
jgi:hypothetical protein